MSVLVMIDGQLLPEERACVSVFDRGFLYGDAVFETMRTYGGAPFELHAHMERLARSAARVLIQFPVALSVIQDEVMETVEQAGNSESFIRVMLTRGTGEFDLAPDVARNPMRVVIVAPLRLQPPGVYSEGVGVVTYRTMRAADATDAVGAKVANYLVSVLAMSQAREAGAAEALVVDRNDCVVEGTTSNVFVVSDGRLSTPPEEAGILLGITRARVLAVARSLGLSPELRPLPLDELRQADEVFISSSIRELVPVVRVDGDPVGSGRPGPTTLRLLQAFRDKIKEDMGL
jgi:branched-chain amino acid aminotransferase